MPTQTNIRSTDCFSLTPAGYAALKAYNAEANAARMEAALTENSDIYDITLAFDAALETADPTAVLRFLERFPRFAKEIVAVGYARAAFGMTLTDEIEEA